MQSYTNHHSGHCMLANAEVNVPAAVLGETQIAKAF